MNPFLRYLADKNNAHTHTDRQTDRHTPLTTRPCGLRRAGNELFRARVNPTTDVLITTPYRLSILAESRTKITFSDADSRRFAKFQ